MLMPRAAPHYSLRFERLRFDTLAAAALSASAFLGQGSAALLTTITAPPSGRDVTRLLPAGHFAPARVDGRAHATYIREAITRQECAQAQKVVVYHRA